MTVQELLGRIAWSDVNVKQEVLVARLGSDTVYEITGVETTPATLYLLFEERGARLKAPATMDVRLRVRCNEGESYMSPHDMLQDIVAAIQAADFSVDEQFVHSTNLPDD